MRVSSLKGMISRAALTPWAVRTELIRLITHPVVALILGLRGVRIAKGVRFYGMPIVQRWRGSHIELGQGVQLRSSLMSNPLVPNHPSCWQPGAPTQELVSAIKRASPEQPS